MVKIWFYSQDESIKAEMQALIEGNWELHNYRPNTIIDENSILLVDMRGIEDLNWQQRWPDMLSYPQALMANNIRVIAIVNESYLDNVLYLLDDGFSDYFKYPYSH